MMLIKFVSVGSGWGKIICGSGVWGGGKAHPRQTKHGKSFS